MNAKVNDKHKRRTWIGLFALLLILLSIIWPRYTQLGLGNFRLSPFYTLGLLCWVLFAVLITVHRHYAPLLRQAISARATPLWLFVAWFAWRMLSSILGDRPAFSIQETLRDILFLGPLLPAALMLAVQDNPIRSLLRLLILATGIVVVVAVLERQTASTVAQLFPLSVSGPSEFISEMLRPNLRAGVLRSKSTFFHPILFAQYLCWVLPLLLCALTYKIGPLFRLAALAMILLTALALTWTGARSALVGAAVAVVVYFALIAIQRARLRFDASIVVLAFAGVLGFIFASFAQDLIQDISLGRDSTEFGSTQVRLRMLEIGLNNIQLSPIWGFGEGRASSYAGNFTGSSSFATIDNFYLSTLLNNGWIGFVLMLSAFASLILYSVKVAIQLRRPLDAALAAGSVALAVTFSIVSLTDGLSLLLISLGSVGMHASAIMVKPPTFHSGAQAPRPQIPLVPSATYS